MLALGFQAFAEGADGGVELQGRQDEHVEGLARHEVAGFGNASLPGPLARLMDRWDEADVGQACLASVKP